MISYSFLDGATVVVNSRWLLISLPRLPTNIRLSLYYSAMSIIRVVYVIIGISTTASIFLYMRASLGSLAAPPIKPIYKEAPRRRQIILFYTTFFGQRPWGYFSIPARKYSEKCTCSMIGCEITFDINKFNASDLVFFHGRDMPSIKHLVGLNAMRPKHQLWVYFVMENPYHAPDVGPLDAFFNLTSSYRLSSDLRFPYRIHERIPLSQVKPTKVSINYAKGKTKQIAWGVSNCGHQRDRLADKLHGFGLQIDQLGGCNFRFTNKRFFPRSAIAPYHEYKFVFAAENRLCRDYVTEKYWAHAFKHNANVIPIVLGGSNYSDPNIAIPGSFIDALKFETPKKLAEYLLLLDKNDTLFNGYFKWKQYWRFPDTRSTVGCSRMMCDACNKLHANGWKLRSNPLTSTVNAANECQPTETFFNSWIDKM